RESDISKVIIMRILHKLHRRELENRVHFCQWGLQRYENDELFFKKVLFTDEASFFYQS
ncbi:hypothetical protein WH47_07003, partial [Habropoda laboriosa]